MSKWRLAGLFVLFVGMVFFGLTWPAATDALPPGLRVLGSDETGIVLELDSPDYALAPAQAGWQHLTAPGLPLMQEAGWPELPVKRVWLGVPADATVELHVLDDEATPVAGYVRLSPAPRPAPISEEFEPGRWEVVPDPAAYASDAPYPAQAARVTGDAWLRDQRVVQVELNPFQYRPAQGQLIWHRQMRVEVRFVRALSGRSVERPDTWQDSAFEPVLRASLLNYDVARAWRGRPQAPQAAWAAASSAAQADPDPTPRFKIVVDHDGIYRLSYADLEAAGMNVAQVDPRTFRLTSQQQDVAVYVAGEEDGQLDPGDWIMFYGQKFRGDRLAARYVSEDDFWPTLGRYGWQPKFNATMLEKYTDENVYWLTAGGSPGPRMAWAGAAPTGAASSPDYYVATSHAERKLTNWTQNFTSEDVFFWEKITTSSSVTKTYTTTLSALSSAPFSVTIRAEVMANNENPFYAPDHRTRFLLNTPANLLQDVAWDGMVRSPLSVTVPQSSLLEGVNTLYVNVITQPVLTNQIIYFDWFEIEYARRLLASSDQLFVSGVPAGAWEYAVGNLLTQTVIVLDVTDPLSPARLLSPTVAANGGVFTATFAVTHTQGARYMAAGETGIQSPKRVTYYAPPDFSSANGADYILITHRDFYTASQVLADYRRGQGLRAMVVDVDDLYNQFNDGIYHSIAIKNFLRYAYEHWQSPAPAYVVLVGDGHWNLKHDSLSGYVYAPVYMPPHMIWADPWQGEVDSSNALASVVGNDMLPDMFIGRIPVNSATELNVVISKTIAYEQAPMGEWQRHTIFVADNVPDGAGDFVQASEDVIAVLPATMLPDRVYLNNYPSSAAFANAITATMNQTGALFLTYTGHGHIKRWTQEDAFNLSSVPSLTNLDRLPIILSMTCMDGYWMYPLSTYSPSLMEAMLRAGNGGMVASFSPTGLGLMEGHDVLNRQFFTSVFSDGVQTLGPAALSAKLALSQTNSHLDLVQTFTIFGDPALRLPTYRLAMSPAVDARSVEPGVIVTYTVMVTNAGWLTDTVAMSVTGQVWPASVSPAVFELGPSLSAEVAVSVEVPLNLLGGNRDAVTVTAQSRGQLSHPAARLETTASVTYAMALGTPQAVRYGDPGAVVTHSVVLTNTGNAFDVYTATVNGNAWPTSLEPTTLGLNPQLSQTFLVSVTIPVTSLVGVSDAVSVTVVSQGSGNGLAQLVTTTSAHYGLMLTADAFARAGQPGATVAYLLQLTNVSNAPDVYTITRAGNAWDTVMTPTMLALGAFEAGAVPVSVTVPQTATPGLSDTVVITVTSQGNGVESVSLTTTASVLYGVVLWPDTATQSSRPGRVVTYALWLTNTGNVSDTFVLTHASALSATLSFTQTTLAAWTGQPVWVQVAVPAAAPAASYTTAVTATMQTGGVAASARLTTEVEWYAVFLPVVIR